MAFFDALAARWSFSLRRWSGPQFFLLSCSAERVIPVDGFCLAPRQLWFFGQLALRLRSLVEKVESQEARVLFFDP
jgi:hypothetical protein